MSQLDALLLAEAVRERLVDFAVDNRGARDARLRDICRAIWAGPAAGGGLVSDLWVEGAFPSEASRSTLDSLAKARLFDPTLRDILDASGGMPRSRPLYTHQDRAIREAHESGESGERPAVVVTAGTGAGKTECFLLPLLDDLYSRPRKAGATGVQCIILYPMNALVNDQVDRLYSWLKNQDRVSIFHFTGETPEDTRRANMDGVPRWEPCRMRTRQEARGFESHDGHAVGSPTFVQAPDIVITNYSMLEYMLCRPQDAVFFGPALRTIVLDEAHLYTGTLADEITLLLRRLLLRCGVQSDQIAQFATSATLGSGDEAQLRFFASGIFTKSPRLVKVITGVQAQPDWPESSAPATRATATTFADLPWPNQPLVVSDAGISRLANDASLCARLRVDLLPHVVAPAVVAALDVAEDRPAVLLRQALAAAPIVHDLERILGRRQRIPLSSLASELWGTEDDVSKAAAVVLLRLVASARTDYRDYPLIPHRIHVMARPSGGLTACLNGACTGAPERRLAPLGQVHGGDADHCATCHAATLALYRCGNCGEWLLAAQLDEHGGMRLRPPIPYTPNVSYFTPRSDAPGDRLIVDPQTAEIAGAGAAGLQLTVVTECPHCREEVKEARPFASGAPLTISILAETVLAALPAYPSPNNLFLPAQGRRLLAFSDSRQEAARLGPRLGQQHETQLVRSAIIRMLERSPVVDEATLQDTRDELAALQAVDVLALTDAQRRRNEGSRARLLQELRDAEAGGRIQAWAENLTGDPVLAQVLDRQHGAKQYAESRTGIGEQTRPWSGWEWEQNAKFVTSQQRAMEYLGREFANPIRSAITGETSGFAEVTYPGLEGMPVPLSLLGQMPTEAARKGLAECWPAVLASLCDTLRMDGAITLGTDDADQQYTFGSVFIGQWATRETDKGYALVPFIGSTVRHRRRQFIASVVQGFGLSEAAATALAPEILGSAFAQLLERAQPPGIAADADTYLLWLQRKERGTRGLGPVEAIRLQFPALGLRRPQQLYRCRLTGHIWARSVLGCAPEQGCAGTLESITEGQLNDDPRYGRQRREYRNSPVFQIGLWADEHSAQLSAKENRRLQDLFKGGIRNILSATTTLELGIDIGGLSGVLMGNVPPGKANYLQRAGRAGRRADGSSAVVTFARPRPFDLAVFADIGRYLAVPLRTPLVLLNRERVVRRHLHALLLNSFFQTLYPPGYRTGAMRAFGSMSQFCGVEVPPKWLRNEKQKPAAPGNTTLDMASTSALPWWGSVGTLDGQFSAYLAWLRQAGAPTMRAQATRLLAGTIGADLANDWSALLSEVDRLFGGAVARWREEYEPLRATWTEAKTSSQANAIRYQMAALGEMTVIESLADRQFLPHYGFPIGLQKLKVIVPDEEQGGRVREEDQYRLERSSLLALREYVPGSQLLVGGKLITSHGLLKHWTGSNIDSAYGFRGECSTCVNKHFYYVRSGSIGPCPICQAPAGESARHMLFPRHGFTSAAWDPPKCSTDVERIGSAQTATLAFSGPEASVQAVESAGSVGGIGGLTVRYREDGTLLVHNAGEYDKGFAICTSCGYAESEWAVDRGAMALPRRFEQHAPISSPRPQDTCPAVGTLRNQILAAEETTDVLLVDFSGVPGMATSDRPLITTLGYALQQAGARLLELDSRELGVLAVPVGQKGGSWGVVLYDNVPGGAGHVRELIAEGNGDEVRGGEWFRLARDVLFVDEAHDASCETACLQCLLAFDAQEAMSSGLLQRRQALATLDSLLGGFAPNDLMSAPDASVPRTNGTSLAQPPRGSAQERVDRIARQRGKRR